MRRTPWLGKTDPGHHRAISFSRHALFIWRNSKKAKLSRSVPKPISIVKSISPSANGWEHSTVQIKPELESIICNSVQQAVGVLLLL